MDSGKVLGGCFGYLDTDGVTVCHGDSDDTNGDSNDNVIVSVVTLSWWQ